MPTSKPVIASGRSFLPTAGHSICAVAAKAGTVVLPQAVTKALLSSLQAPLFWRTMSYVCVWALWGGCKTLLVMMEDRQGCVLWRLSVLNCATARFAWMASRCGCCGWLQAARGYPVMMLQSLMWRCVAATGGCGLRHIGQTAVLSGSPVL